MTELTGLAEQVGEALLKRGRVLATAESCTGGWVTKLVTDIAGSSEWFDRGFVTYSNASKQDMLGVPAETLESDGAVPAAGGRASRSVRCVLPGSSAGARRGSRRNTSAAIVTMSGNRLFFMRCGSC
jgi:hypothetical protein